MSKGLEVLKSIQFDYCLMDERTDTIEKELKALEIIKIKNVNVDYLKVALSLDSLSYYNALVGKERQLTQKEYDLLKEVLL